MPSYLLDLTLRLAAGTRRLAEPVRGRHAAYLARAQNDDGGFSAREGPSDLYYTSFALRALGLLGELDERRAERAAGFLRRQIPRARCPASISFRWSTSAVLVEMATGVDPFAASGRDRRQELAERVAPFRRPDGGYAKTPRGRPGQHLPHVPGRRLQGDGRRCRWTSRGDGPR